MGVTAYKNSVPALQKARWFFVTETNWLIVFRENIAVYCSDHNKRVSAVCGQNVETGCWSPYYKWFNFLSLEENCEAKLSGTKKRAAIAAVYAPSSLS
jgi:hypothetical protein